MLKVNKWIACLLAITLCVFGIGAFASDTDDTQEEPQLQEEPQVIVEYEEPVVVEEPVPETIYYKVLFLNDDGQVLLSVSVEDGHLVQKPDLTPTREGFRFLYWKVLGNGTARYDFNTPVTHALSLVPYWEAIEIEEENKTQQHVTDEPTDPDELTDDLAEVPVEGEDATEPILPSPDANVYIVANVGATVRPDDKVTFTAVMKGFEDTHYTLTWQYDSGSGWQTAQTGEFSYSFTLDEASFLINWRLVVTVATGQEDLAYASNPLSIQSLSTLILPVEETENPDETGEPDEGEDEQEPAPEPTPVPETAMQIIWLPDDTNAPESMTVIVTGGDTLQMVTLHKNEGWSTSAALVSGKAPLHYTLMQAADYTVAEGEGSVVFTVTLADTPVPEAPVEEEIIEEEDLEPEELEDEILQEVPVERAIQLYTNFSPDNEHAYGETILISAELSGFENVDYTLVWMCDKGNGFEPIADATGTIYGFVFAEENDGWSYMLRAIIHEPDAEPIAVEPAA